MRKGDVITVVVTAIASYGLFIEYKKYKGLVHISEISDRYVDDINDFFKIGEKIDCLILSVDNELNQLTLSYKKALKVCDKIIEEIDIKIGFRTLKQALPYWIKEKAGDEDND